MMLDILLLSAAMLVLISILLAPFSARIGAPLLLFFLLIGMLAGEDGPGGIDFDDFELAYEIGTGALGLILLSGGLDTPLRDLRQALAPAVLLATVGVAVTALVAGAAAVWALEVAWPVGILLGAVVASTDAAATFLLLRQSGVKLAGRMREIILVESGLNDPMAIFLTIAFVAMVDAGMGFSLTELHVFLPDLARQLGIGALAGVAVGFGTARLARVVTLPSGLYAPFVLAAAAALFAATRLVDGSGFLAVYLFGIAFVAGARHVAERVRQFHEGIAWLSQIVMFLMLGLLVTPRSLADTLVPALIIAMVLIFVARPLAVATVLTPFRVPLRQQAYVGWVGLRGAVPIFLAIIPVASPGPITVEFFNVVFVIVIVSLLLQGWTISPMARWLRVTGTAPEGDADDTKDV